MLILILILIATIVIYYYLFFVFIGYNYNNLALRHASNEIVLINIALLDRIKYIKLKQKKSVKRSKMIYIGTDYLKNENDITWIDIVFIIFQIIVFFLVFKVFLIDKLSFQIILGGIIIFFLNWMLGMEIVHCYSRKEKRRQTDAVIVFFFSMITAIEKYKTKGSIFIGNLIFQNDSLVTITTDKKKKPDLRIYPLNDIKSVLCKYKEKTILASVTVKDGIYETEFSKFIFESEEVEKDYFKDLYEFPFMERSTVYDFEKLHHDIMQDLVDEERTFYFQDYLIKEEAS